MSFAKLVVSAAAAKLSSLEVPQCTDLVPVETGAEHEDLFCYFTRLRQAERTRIREEQELQRLQKLRKLPAAVLDTQEPTDSRSAGQNSVKSGEVAQQSQGTSKPSRPAWSSEEPRKRGRPANALVSTNYQQAENSGPRSSVQSFLSDDGSVRNGCIPALMEIALQAKVPALRLAILEALERTALSGPHQLGQFFELNGPRLLSEWLLDVPLFKAAEREAKVAVRSASAANQHSAYVTVAFACLRVMQLLPVLPDENQVQALLQVREKFPELKTDAAALATKWRTQVSQAKAKSSQARDEEKGSFRSGAYNSSRNIDGRYPQQGKDVSATLKEIQELGKLLESQCAADEAANKDCGHTKEGKESKKRSKNADSRLEARNECWDGYFPDPFL